MARTILLDTNVVGLLTGPGPKPGKPDQQTPCRQWFSLRLADADLVISDVVDYEIRRELIRAGFTAQLARLDALLTLARPMPVTPEAWIKAAEFWALVRQGGLPTAHPEALDGDAILAGVAATVGGEGDAVIVASTNARHLERFPGIVAEAWEAIMQTPASRPREWIHPCSSHGWHLAPFPCSLSMIGELGQKCSGALARGPPGFFLLSVAGITQVHWLARSLHRLNLSVAT